MPLPRRGAACQPKMLLRKCHLSTDVLVLCVARCMPTGFGRFGSVTCLFGENDHSRIMSFDFSVASSHKFNYDFLALSNNINNTEQAFERGSGAKSNEMPFISDRAPAKIFKSHFYPTQEYIEIRLFRERRSALSEPDQLLCDHKSGIK